METNEISKNEENFGITTQRLPRDYPETTQRLSGVHPKNIQSIIMTKRDEIIRVIKENPKITQAEMADLLGLTIDGVKYHIKKLKSEGILERIGSDYGGYWNIKDV